jgi:ABC-2 type transport system permease protein
MSAESGPWTNLLNQLQDSKWTDWYPVAKKDVQDSLRSLRFLILSAVFITIFVLPLAVQQFTGLNLISERVTDLSDIGMELIINIYYLNIVTFFVPIIAILASYGAISKEKESGSLKILLSLPFSRKDAVAGKVIGRSAVVAVPLLIAFTLAAVFLALSPITFDLDIFLVFVVYSLLFTVWFVAVAVSVSGAVPSTTWSAITNTFIFIYLTFAWNSLANGVGSQLADWGILGGSTRWSIVLLLKLLNPSQAYKTLVNSMLGDGSGSALSARFGMFSRGQGQETLTTVCSGALRGNASEVQGLLGNQTVCNESANAMPLYFSDAAVFGYFFLGIAVAAAISYFTFNLYDL